MIRNSNSAKTTNSALTIVPKGDVFLDARGEEAGEPSVASGHVARAPGIHEPYVLQASDLLSSKTWDEQMTRHWG